MRVCVSQGSASMLVHPFTTLKSIFGIAMPVKVHRGLLIDQDRGHTRCGRFKKNKKFVGCTRPFVS